MFRAYLGPSSGGTTVCIQQLVLIFLNDSLLCSRTPGNRSFGWIPVREPGVSVYSGNLEKRGPGIAGKCGFQESPGNPGCRSRSDLWIPGVTPDSRSNPEKRELGVPSDSGNSELWATPGTRSSGWLMQRGVNPGTRSGLLREPGVIPGTRSDSGNQEYQVNSGNRCSWFRVTPVTRISGWVWEHGVPVNSGNPWWIREPVVPGDSENPFFRVPVDSGNTEFRVTPGIQNSGDSGNSEFRVTQGTRSDTGNTFLCVTPWAWVHSKNPDFRVTPGTGSFRRLRDWMFWLIPGSRNSGWLLEPGVPGLSWTRSSEWLRETRVPDASVNPKFRWLRLYGVAGDSWNPGWLREPVVLGDSWKLDSQVSPGTRSSRWIREPVVPGSYDSGNPWATADSRKTEFRVLRDPVVPGDFVESPGTPGSLFRVTPWIRSFGWRREPWFPRGSGNPESPGTPGSRSHPVLRVSDVPGDFGHPRFRSTPGPRCSCWLRVTQGTRCSGWLRKPWMTS